MLKTGNAKTETIHTVKHLINEQFHRPKENRTEQESL
jgi:hypothetical protein